MNIAIKLSQTALVVFYAITAVLVVATIGLIIAAINVSAWFWIGVAIAAIVTLASGGVSVAATVIRKKIQSEIKNYW